jgi:hypothetical protein
MDFNRRKLEEQRGEAAEREAASRHATGTQVLEDAERLIAAWNERQAKRMPLLFSPTIGAAVAARYCFLWIRCPAWSPSGLVSHKILLTVLPKNVCKAHPDPEHAGQQNGFGHCTWRIHWRRLLGRSRIRT